MSGAARLLLAAALAAAASGPPSLAEIRREIREDGLVASNLRPAAPLPVRQSLQKAPPPAPGEAMPPELASLVINASSKHGFDPALVRAVILAESGFDPMAVSVKGARGLMQLMPQTAARYGLRDVHDPGSNLEAGLTYLREMLSRHGGDMKLALAAYNAGPESVARYGGVPPYEETLRYIEKIRGQYGDDLDAGDWSDRSGEIRLRGVDAGGTPHFTNLPSRRIVGRTVDRTAAGGSGASRHRESR